MYRSVYASLLLLFLLALPNLTEIRAQLTVRGTTEPEYVEDQFIAHYNTPQDPVVIEQRANLLDATVINVTNDDRDFLLELLPTSNYESCTIEGHNAGARSTLQYDAFSLNYVASTDPGQLPPAPTGIIPSGGQLLHPFQNCEPEGGNVSTDAVHGKRKVKVAVLDSRIDPSQHQSLFGNSLYSLGVHSQISHELYFAAQTSSHGNNSNEDSEHGTAVGGIIAYFMQEIGALQQLELYSIPVLGREGMTDLFTVFEGLHLAKLYDVDIVNMSFGFFGASCGGETPELLRQQIATSAFTVVASAGNNGLDLDGTNRYPATVNLPNVITVGSVDCQGEEISYWSNHSKNYVDLLAPGENIVVPYSPGEYVIRHGTSFSAPVVTGVLAKLMTSNTPESAVEILLNSALPVSDLMEYTELGVLHTTCPNDDCGPEHNPTVFAHSGPYHSSTTNTDMVSAYPNPFEDQLKVNLPADSEITSALLLDFTGRIVARTQVQGNSAVRFDASQLPTGQYFIILRDQFTTHRPIPVLKR